MSAADSLRTAHPARAGSAPAQSCRRDAVVDVGVPAPTPHGLDRDPEVSGDLNLGEQSAGLVRWVFAGDALVGLGSHELPALALALDRGLALGSKPQSALGLSADETGPSRCPSRW